MVGVAVISWFSFTSIAVVAAHRIPFYLYLSLFFITFAIILLWRKPTVRFFLLALLFIIFGAWRALSVVPDCKQGSAICHYNEKTTTFTGWIAADPDIRTDKTNYTVEALSVGKTPVTGKVLVQAKYHDWYYGETITVQCKLETPKNFGDDDSTFQYDKYLADQGVFSLCDFPKISRTAGPRHFITAAMKPILDFKHLIAARISQLFPEPNASLLGGILYGSKAGLPKAISDNFSRTGITHIIAVSGFNITIIATALMAVLISIGLWRRQAFWVVLAGVWLFTIFSGLSASAVRAAIMGTLVLVAGYLGRQSHMGTSLVFTAAVMTLINPYVFLWDAGFQLSFLATIGLVYISPIIETWWPEADEKVKRTKVQKTVANIITTIREPLLTTLSAIIATTPLILYQFGRLSLVAPLVNVLVLWTIPLIMLGGFIIVTLSFIFFPVALALAGIVGTGLSYVILVANAFGNQSWSALTFQLPWWGMAALYIILFDYVQTKRQISPL